MKFTIPALIRITAKIAYEVLFVEDFKDGKTAGECRWDLKQIVIKNGMSKTETVKTFIHETIHAIDGENKIGLTETQVLKLEEGIYRTLRLNGWLK